MDEVKKKELLDLFCKMAVELLRTECYPEEIFRFCAESFLALLCKNLDFSFEEHQEAHENMKLFTDIWLSGAQQELFSILKKREEKNVHT